MFSRVICIERNVSNIWSAVQKIVVYDYEGNQLLKLGGDDIFGVSYPWLEDMQLLDDGSLLIMLTQERDDGSANELMFF